MARPALRWPTVLLGAALSTSAPRPGLADTPVSPPSANAEELNAARKLFADGLRAEDAGAWASALEIFLRIRKITVSPVLLYHLGLCYEHVGSPPEAIAAFELAAQQAAMAGKQDVAAEARAHIAALREKVARLVIELPDGAKDAEIEVDGKPIQANDAAAHGATVVVEPGEHRVRAQAADRARAFAENVAVAAGATMTIHVQLAPSAPPVGAAPADPKERDLLSAFVTGGVAIALGAGAAVTGVVAHDKHQEYVAENDAPTRGSLESRRALRSEGTRLALVSTLLTGGAIAAGGTAAYLFLAGRHASADRAGTPGRPTLSVAPWASIAGGGVIVEGSL